MHFHRCWFTTRKRSSFRRASDRIAFGRTGPQKARRAGRSKRLSVQGRETGDSLRMDNARTGVLLRVAAVGSTASVLACAFVPGLADAIGGLIQFLGLHSDKFCTPAGLGLIGGVLLVMIGVGICARAGMLREQMTKQAQMNRSPRRGILMGVVSGIGAAAMNFGVAFGSPVVEAAPAPGANPASRINSVWLPLMAAGAIPNLFYCAYLMRSKRTSANFSVNGTGRYWLFASVMAVFWFASTLMYGVASLKLGVLGPVYGWPFFMSLIVIVSSVIGILAGEWKHATRSAVGLQFAGVAVLITSVIMLSYTGRHL